MSGIESIDTETRTFRASNEFIEKAYIKSEEQYLQMYKQSLEDPDSFWSERAKDITWFKEWDSVFEWKDKKQKKFTWFDGSKTNVCYNCLDRHLETKGDEIALIWQGEPEEDVIKYTYKELHKEVCRFSNVLKKKGIKKGDKVAIYLPMIPQLAISLLACARIGAVHSVVFGGFSASALKDRINYSECKLLITVDGSLRAGKKIPLKDNVDEALKETPSIESVIVVKRVDTGITLKEGLETWWDIELNSQDILDTCDYEKMNAEDPLFILFTSGTTGKPKGVLHTTAGYLVYVNQTFKYVFDYHPGDVYWCTADIGWITGHSYIVYGPLSNAATTLMFEGVPTYPDNSRFWSIVEKFKVNIFYTAPTVIRSLMRFGNEPVNKHDLSSLKLLGSVGEPINPEAWLWYYKTIGKENCPIVDTWWQTETGGILISALPGAVNLKPGAAGKPFFGIEPEILTEDGTRVDANQGGNLIIKRPWPGMMRTVYNDHQRFLDTYWSKYPDVYFTGDGAKVDKDGDCFILGRIDDVVNISGHRLGAAEIESSLVSNTKVAEAAVVPFPHEIKGHALYAFVILKEGIEPTDDLVKELRSHVGKVIGPIAKPDKIQFTEQLPKTRSGKIMRRILKSIAEGKEDVGNTTTLVNPEIVDKLKEERI